MRISFYLDPNSSHQLVTKIRAQQQVDALTHSHMRSAANVTDYDERDRSVLVEGVLYSFEAEGIRYISTVFGAVPTLLSGAPVQLIKLEAWQEEKPLLTNPESTGGCTARVWYDRASHQMPDGTFNIAHTHWRIEIVGQNFDNIVALYHDIIHGELNAASVTKLPSRLRTKQEIQALEVVQQAVMDGRLTVDQIIPYLVDPDRKIGDKL